MSLPADPLFGYQWHLRNTTPGLLDLNIVRANGVDSLWDDYTGRGINVFVIDDGFDYNHEDLRGNYQTSRDYDFLNNDADAFGLNNNSHGTAVAGIIGASGENGVGVVGIAYRANIIGYQTAAFINDGWLQDIRDSITTAAANGADVVNISQGIANDLNSEFGFGYNAVRFAEIDLVIDYAVATGRGGLGTNIVKSAGNSRGGDYDVNSDPWTKNSAQIVVAAVDQNGFVSSYSSFGAANLVSGFGTPGQVVTTDRSGAAGYNGTNYTSTFNGTSSAAPMVSGVVTLMLDANEGLGWRDVQTILAYSARHVGSAVNNATVAGSERTPWDWNMASNWNGGGLHYSMDYGYGLVDAHAAVRLAETWGYMGVAQTSANQVMTHVDAIPDGGSVVIADGNLSGTSFLMNETDSITVERLTLELDFQTTFLGDVEIYLRSPTGVEHLLIRDQAGGADFNGRYTFHSQAFRGESSVGNWTVRIVDDALGDTLTIRDIDLRLFGSAATNNDRYFFTEEYSRFAGTAGHRTNYADTNGGSDFINAAAITTAMSIDLRGGASFIDGLLTTFSGIEHIIAGDGNDILYGTSGANTILGARGDDIIYGNGGGDFLDGGTGQDTVSYGLLAQAVTVNLFNRIAIVAGQNDTLNNIENVHGTIGADHIVGNDVDNVFVGFAGSDYINGLGGNDTVRYDYASMGVYVDLTAQLGWDGVAQDTFFSIESAGGSAYNDILYGNNLDNTFEGLLGNDHIYGLGGNDTVSYSYSTTGVMVDLTGGNSWDGVAMDWLYSIENVIGSVHNDFIYGNAQDNVFEGLDGADRFFGYDGSDTVTYHRHQRAVTIDLTGGSAADGVATDLLYSIENAVGSRHDDLIWGSAGANRIEGGFGEDYLVGAGGNDIFVFGSSGTGVDVIADFDANPAGGQDLLDLSGRGFGAASIGAAILISQAGANTHIDIGSDRIVLINTNAADINSSDFLF